jgi:hypothetical protein
MIMVPATAATVVRTKSRREWERMECLFIAMMEKCWDSTLVASEKFNPCRSLIFHNKRGDNRCWLSAIVESNVSAPKYDGKPSTDSVNNGTTLVSRAACRQGVHSTVQTSAQGHGERNHPSCIQLHVG